MVKLTDLELSEKLGHNESRADPLTVRAFLPQLHGPTYDTFPGNAVLHAA